MAAIGPQVCLEVRQIKKSYGDQTVLRNISFSLPEGEILGLIGPNGAGKTTLFNIISGWQKPGSGSVVFFGQETTAWRPERLSQAGLARTFQVPQIFPEMSVWENVLMGAWLGREPHPPIPQAQEEAHNWLSLAGLMDKRHTRARDLPLPQQRLLELARALATRPRLLLLDEIAAGFSPGAVKRLAAGLLKMRDQGLTLLLTDHVLILLEAVADRLLALDRGEIIAQGPTSSLIRHPEVVAAYLGTRVRRRRRRLMPSGATSPPLLAVQHLSVSQQGAPVLVDLSFTCFPHQIVAIVGIEGAGKTTLLKAIGGLQRPLAGRIFFAGEPIEAFPVWEVVRRGVIYVPEGMRVFPGMTVLENLEVGAYLVRRQLDTSLDRVCHIFPELKDRLQAPAGVLSGGQQRMVTLARGLMSAPRLLMLDEPFMGLSPKLVQRFCNSFRELRQSGVTLLISGQLVQRVLNVAEKAYVLEKGRITFSGTGPHLLQDPHLQEIIFPV